MNYLKRCSVIIIAALILICEKTQAKAGWLNGDESLGGISHVLDQFYKQNPEGFFTEEDLNLLSAAMELENGCNSDLCLLYTGSVILNRTKLDWCPNTIEGVLLQKGQYAEHTVNNLYTVKVSERTRRLAMQLLMFGSLDETLVFQSMQPHLGKVKYIVDGEYFATAR